MPLPHETLLVPHRTSEENLAASSSSAPGAASHATSHRTRRGGAGRTNPLAGKMAAMGDKFRGRGRNASRGRSTNTTNDNNTGGRSHAGRSRSRSVDSWGRSQSPSARTPANRGGSRDATPRGQRKGRLFRNYAAYASARRRSSNGEFNDEGGQRGLNDEGMQEPARARPNKWLVQAFQVNPKFANLSRNKRHDEEAGHPPSTRAAKGGSAFVLPPGVRPAPRVDAWLAFAVASCAAVASIGQIHASSKGMGMSFSSGDTFALSTCAMSFMVSLGVAGGLRYAPLRTALTSPRFAMGPTILAPLGLTVELLLLAGLLVFWTATMPIVVNGNAYYQGSTAGVPLAMAGEGIWNANLFYSSWASFLLCGYLLVEVGTLPDRRGTIRSDASASKRAANAFTKRWTLLFLDAVVLLSASIVTYTSPACSGSFLKQTTYCTRAVWGMMTGGLLQILVAVGVAVLYRLASMGPHSRRRGATLSATKRNSGCGVAALASLILQSVNAGMVTSPNGGGPGTSSGTLYFASWLGFALAFELCLRYLELKTTARTSTRSRGLRSEVEHTVYEDESDEEVLMLRNGSEGGSGRSRNSTVVEGTVLEDASVDDDGIDAQSFVFEHTPRGAGPVREVRQLSPEERRRHDAHEQAYLSQVRNQPTVASASAMRRKLEPEELRQASSGSGGEDSGTDPLAGSIDVRSAQRSTSGESSNKDPDGEAEFHKSIRYETLPEGDLGQEHFFGAPRGAPAGFTSFHMESVEKLDEPHDAREPDGNNAMRHPSRVSEVTPRHPSNFSPIEEGSGEDTSPNTGSSPEKKSGSSGEQRRIGDNLKSVQAAQRPMRTADRSKKSGSSRGSRSRERGLHALPAGGGAGTSRQTSSSRRTGSTTHSAVSKKSARSRRSGLSTVSSRQGADQSAVLTDDDVSGSNPPPTISEAGGSGSAPSTMSAPSTQSGSGQAPQQVMGTIRPGKAAGGGGPPPPPFLRSKHPSAHDAYDDKSQYSSSAPLRSIHTTPAEHGGSSDTIVSDPTLDAGLDDPSPQQVTKPQATRASSKGRPASSGRATSRSRSRGRQDHHDSPSTTSYEKKYSDETDVQATSSDDNPSSQEAGSKGNRVVDNIVAAALAYAEKTHGEDGPHGISRSGTTSGGKTGGSSGPRPQGKAKASVRKSTGDHTAASGHHSSIHSFYTEDEGKGAGTPDKRSNSRSTGNPRYGAAAPVDDLVAKALSHANAQLTAGQAGGGQGRSSSDGQKALKVGQQAWAAQQRPQPGRASSEYSAGQWVDGAKSVGSMYSAGTDEFSEKDVGMHFDC